MTTLTNTCIIYCIVTDVYEVMKSLNLPWIKTPQGLWKIYNTLQENVTASQSQAILMMQKCIEKDTQGIWSKRILGRDSPISMVSLSQRAPSIYRPWEKQGQHHIKLSQCHIYIYIIKQDYTPTPDCVYIFANTCIYFLFIVKSISVKKRFINWINSFQNVEIYSHIHKHHPQVCFPWVSLPLALQIQTRLYQWELCTFWHSSETHLLDKKYPNK